MPSAMVVVGGRTSAVPEIPITHFSLSTARNAVKSEVARQAQSNK